MKDGYVRGMNTQGCRGGWGGRQGVGRSLSNYGVASAHELSSSIYEKSYNDVLNDTLTFDNVSQSVMMTVVVK